MVNNTLTFTTPPGNNLIKKKVKLILYFKSIINYNVNTLMLIFL